MTRLAAIFLLASLIPAPSADLASILEPLASAKGTVPSGDSVKGSQRLDDRTVAEALAGELASRMRLDGELRLMFAYPWKTISLPESTVWKVSIIQAPATDLTPSLNLRFRIEADGKQLGEWQSVMQAQLLKPVWFVTRRMERGSLPDSTVCESQLADVLRDRASLVPADTDLSLYEMAQTVAQERPLTWKDVSLRPLVKKGEMVEVVANEGAMNITMKGVALASGRAGEAIMVRNPDSRKEFSARVVRPNTVEVKF